MGKTVIDEMVARGLLMRLGFNGAGQWQEGKMIRTINNPVDLTDDVKELGEEWKPIYKRVLDAHQNGGVEIRMCENGDATKIETPKQDKKKAEKKKKVEKEGKEAKVKATKEAKPKAELDKFGCRKDSVGAKANSVLTKTPKAMQQIMKEAKIKSTIYHHLKKMVDKGHVKFTGKEGFSLAK